MEISYTYEPSRAYAKAIGEAKTPEALESAITPYSMIAPDAIDLFHSAEFHFREWHDGLLLERSGKFAGEAWITKYGPLVMPTLMMRVEMLAGEYKVPFGLMYIRLRELGQIVEQNGRALWVG